ncbi:inorganic phosphate transporter [Paraglaciecola chathamensis]|jgi:PiT family inorganic phosphate transporter|uniref:Phosphate transporter n=3 Tax=Paraglaciecola chathamensis TaxID=368405 RepID=A0A8H9IAW1_9ALTE|nr:MULTISPECIES: inorganic phosphate transporter [Paraglaciecola]AEE21993.1 phosphate transporter [Glaciecola sp. 4H-3-7+YE-5]MBN25826.1 inorganic phosphate transporter [Alteromonadaceae bacterium]GAC06690.1 inorganic phosphate transporter, PiT family [Paraglaciecola agarilytica NO2]GAC10448.1 inorganic phosphate transporter, PiT family [Paraglaciecola chathamensis S18K6]GGZ46787.1 phosphate transporter [Paraglaciecola oceanifecundans]|tara:strand:+ start:49374 stop:50642 length:1269 start_codon:yes stop_codon:yes gene_type:complete
MDILQTYGFTLIVVAALVGFLMAWGIGANDVANAMGTSVGSKALTIKQAILIAMVFEFAGAYLAGGEVTSTIRKGILDSTFFIDSPELLVYGMISALLAAGIWLGFASYLGWPVSTTHSIVGALVGFAAVGVSADAVEWSAVGGIVGSWVITPAISGFIAFLIFQSAQKLIFDTDKPFDNARRYVPFYMGLAGFVMSLVTIKKGLKHVGLHIEPADGYYIAIAIAILVGIVGKYAISRVQYDSKADKRTHFANVEKIFAILMIVTACCMAFAHGSNDVANAIGPLAAVVSIIHSDGEISNKAGLVWWILPLGGLGIVAGLALFGHRVIATIGNGITHLTPSRGFAAELAAACTVVLASGTGLPISTTQTLVGAVLGVGMARGIAAINLGVVRNIVVSWVVTLPAGAGLSILFFFVLKGIFAP